MAISKEVALDIIDRFKAVTLEHGDVSYIVSIKTEDNEWKYSINAHSDDAMIMAKVIIKTTKDSEP